MERSGAPAGAWSREMASWMVGQSEAAAGWVQWRRGEGGGGADGY